ncbi:uncharacterized protein LOC132760157 isoform X2 [Ruditapes philippinarum]|uniref:uncharacterized protein LOC132760157 isoform X2 n=1 Tax=Ruditapes philippinarum TaxID=129788 RepID=UPI00295A8CAA|nr:uncharacterized protein LOC132760157 isoform X2 [Ruditapes philippinarum]
MWKHQQYSLLFLVKLVFFIFLDNYLLADKIHFSKWLRVNKNKTIISTFETISSISVGNCVNSCKARKRCEFINYNVHYKACFLIGLINATDVHKLQQYNVTVLESKSGYVFGNKSEWKMENYGACRGCNYQGFCDSEENTPEMPSTCVSSGCGVPVLEINGLEIYGNMYNAGDKVIFKCNDTFYLKMLDNFHANVSVVTALCNSNGFWEYPKFTCTLTNVAINKTVNLSSQYSDVSPGNLMVDGDRSKLWPCTSTSKEAFPWAIIDLEHTYTLFYLYLANRINCCPDRLHNLKIYVGESETSFELVHSREEVIGESCTVNFNPSVQGRYVKLQIEATEYLTICELEVYAVI